MKKIVIINGPARAGKDTFVKLCGKYCNVMNYSAVDGIKEIAKQMGWDGTKDEKSRKFLSDLKDLADEFNDFSTICIENKIKEFMSADAEILFLHMREPDQIQSFQQKYKNALSLLIRNDRINVVTSNHADKNIFKYLYDMELDNSGTLEELEETAHVFVDRLRD